MFRISIHAPLRERQLWLYKIGITPSSFQSTLPYRSDSERDFRIVYTAISIHAPLQERRRLALFIGSSPRISIHAPSRERRQTLFDDNIVTNISIRAPSRERQPSQLYVQHHPYHFNPRSLAGATWTTIRRYPTRCVFHSTLPHGSDTNMGRSGWAAT